MVRKSYYHTTINLTDEDVDKKHRAEKLAGKPFTFIGIFRIGLEYLMTSVKKTT